MSEYEGKYDGIGRGPRKSEKTNYDGVPEPARTGPAKAALAVDKAYKPGEAQARVSYDPPAEKPAASMPNPKDLIGVTKVPLRLFPPIALARGAMVMKRGVEKYGPFNWREGDGIHHTVYLEAAMRHIQAVLDGEDIDADTQQPPEANAMMCMAIILDARETGHLIDDRDKSGKLQVLMDMFQEKAPE